PARTTRPPDWRCARAVASPRRTAAALRRAPARSARAPRPSRDGARSVLRSAWEPRGTRRRAPARRPPRAAAPAMRRRPARTTTLWYGCPAAGSRGPLRRRLFDRGIRQRRRPILDREPNRQPIDLATAPVATPHGCDETVSRIFDAELAELPAPGPCAETVGTALPAPESIERRGVRHDEAAPGRPRGVLTVRAVVDRRHVRVAADHQQPAGKAEPLDVRAPAADAGRSGVLAPGR